MGNPMRPIDRVLETILYVDDLDAAERFYDEVLGLELDSRKDGLFVFFRCGDSMLLLFEPEAAATGRNVPAHGARGPGHACFAVAEDALPAWQARLAAAGVAVEQEVTWPRGGRSFYFRDPAGNSLELATPRIWGLPEVAPPGTPP
jgi:catechol 2,3-dioxygenase-like lactoylglutathione lyase family enzyme